MLHLPKNIKIVLSHLLPGSNTPCFYSQENLFLLIGVTLAGKGQNSSLSNQKLIGQFNLFLFFKDPGEVFITLNSIKSIYYTEA